jgi:hypothetical protein
MAANAVESTPLEFGQSVTLSSKNLLGLVVDQDSACNRFIVEEQSTGRKRWVLSDLQPLYGYLFEGGDLTITVDSPSSSNPTTPITFNGYNGSKVMLMRQRHECEPLPNLQLPTYGRPDTKVVRQIAYMPTTLADVPFTLASVFVEGYKYVSCTISYDPVVTTGAGWFLRSYFAADPRWDIVAAGANAVAGVTTTRGIAGTLQKGNAGAVNTAFDNMTMSLEPLPVSKVEAVIDSVGLNFLNQNPMSVVWQFSNTPMTERF